VLEEMDGPMLEHGLKGRHGQRLMAAPKVRAERPDPDLLDEHYTSFLAVG
jgi:putative restriction endonuclease